MPPDHAAGMKYDVCRSELMILSGASAPCIVLFLIAEAGSLMHFPDAEIGRRMFKKVRFYVIADTALSLFVLKDLFVPSVSGNCLSQTLSLRKRWDKIQDRLFRP